MVIVLSFVIIAAILYLVFISIEKDIQGKDIEVNKDIDIFKNIEKSPKVKIIKRGK